MRSFRIIHDCQNQKTRFADILIGFHPSYSIGHDRYLQRHDWHCACFKLKDKEPCTQCSMQQLICILSECHYRTGSAFKGIDCLIKRGDNCFPTWVSSYELHGNLYLLNHASQCKLTFRAVLCRTSTSLNLIIDSLTLQPLFCPWSPRQLSMITASSPPFPCCTHCQLSLLMAILTEVKRWKRIT